MEETQAPQRQKLDGKDRVIQQLEGQRNNALTQAALFGAELESTREVLAETENKLAMSLLNNQVLTKKIEGLEAPPPAAEGATVATPAANDSDTIPATGATDVPGVIPGTEG